MKRQLQKAMRRQTELTTKLMAGDITEKEKTELTEVNLQIKKATEPHKVTRKTLLTTMKLSEFRSWVEKVTEGEPTADELAVIKYNLEQVKQQGITDPDGIVAVQVLAKETYDDVMARMEARIEQLEQQVAEKNDQHQADSGGKNDQSDGGENGNDETAPTAMAIAMEALTATTARFEELRQKFESGDVTSEDVYKAWPEYEIREIVEGAAAIMSKFETLKGLFDDLVPKIKAAQGDEESGNDDSDTDDSDDGTDTDDGSDGDNTGDGDGETDAEKDAAVKAFMSGQDMAPRSEGGTADYKMIKSQGNKHEERVPGTPYRA